MRRKLLYTALLLVLCSTTATAEGVQLKDSWTILQPGNNVDININQTFSVERLRVEPGYTVIDRANFSASGSTSDKITVNLSWYNKTAALNEYAANFTVDTTDGNNVNFSLGLPSGQDYQVDRDGAKMKSVESLSGPLWFNHSSWSSHTFTVKTTGSASIQNEKGFGTEYGSGTVRYGQVIDTNYTATEKVQVENTDSSATDADLSQELESVTKCTVQNDTVQSIPANSFVNLTFHKDCRPGTEVSHEAITTTRLTDYKRFTYTATTEVYSNVTEEEPHDYCIPQSRLTDWELRDPSETSATVDGSGTDVTVDERTLGGTDYICINTGDEHTQSSKHTGTHTEELVYKTKLNTGDSGGTSSGSSSDDDDTDDEETDGENATADNTTNDQSDQPGWTASWQDAIGDTVMTAKRDGTAYLQVANQHNRSVNLTFQCVAETDICQYVNVVSDPVTVTASGTETIPVTWTFPDNTSTAPPADPTFDIQITDAASNETATVTVTVVDSLFGPVLPDNFSAPGAARPYLPLLFVPFIGAFAVFVTMRLAQRGKPLSGWDVVIPAAVFMILAVPLAVFILLRVIHA